MKKILKKLEINVISESLEDTMNEYESLHYFNFRGCNISNLEYLAQFGTLYHENFDSIEIESHPNLFLSNLFSQEFQRKFYDKNLFIDDIVNLNSKQIQELKQKDIIRHFNLETNNLLIETFGIDKLVELLILFRIINYIKCFRYSIKNICFCFPI